MPASDTATCYRVVWGLGRYEDFATEMVETWPLLAGTSDGSLPRVVEAATHEEEYANPMTDNRRPRSNAETQTALGLWVIATIPAGFAVWIAMAPPKGQPWIAFGLLVAVAVLGALWAAAIWHGGFEGRRYDG